MISGAALLETLFETPLKFPPDINWGVPDLGKSEPVLWIDVDDDLEEALTSFERGDVTLAIEQFTSVAEHSLGVSSRTDLASPQTTAGLLNGSKLPLIMIMPWQHSTLAWLIQPANAFRSIFTRRKAISRRL